MWNLFQHLYRSTATALVVTALAIELAAKRLAFHAIIDSEAPRAMSTAQLSDGATLCGILTACVAVVVWIASIRRREAGSQLPFVLLFCLYCLMSFIVV